MGRLATYRRTLQKFVWYSTLGIEQAGPTLFARETGVFDENQLLALWRQRPGCCRITSQPHHSLVAEEQAAEVQASDPSDHFGTIAVANDQSVTIAFSRPVSLALGSVVYIYGPGKVEYHPMDKNMVLKEHRRVVGKAQVLEKMANSGYRASIFWQAEDATLETGFDAVPEPDATVPDVPPVYQAETVTGFQSRCARNCHYSFAD